MFGLFGNRREVELNSRCNELEKERDGLRDQVSEARGQLADFKQQKKAEEEEIKHTLKMERERADIEKIKYQTECDRKMQEEIAKVKDQYRDKMENELRAQIERAGGMYSEILKRLPNISAKLTGSVT